MTKVELIEQVTGKTGLAKKEVEGFLETAIATIQNALKTGGKVSLMGLGTFVVTDKKARMGRNPKTGAQVQIPAKKAVKFKPGKELKEVIQ